MVAVCNEWQTHMDQWGGRAMTKNGSYHTINPSPYMFLPSCAMLPLLLCFFLHIQSQQCWCTSIKVPPTDKHKNKTTWCKHTRYIFFLWRSNWMQDRTDSQIVYVLLKPCISQMQPPSCFAMFYSLLTVRIIFRCCHTCENNTRLQHTRLWASVLYFLSMIVRGWMVYIYTCFLLQGPIYNFYSKNLKRKRRTLSASCYMSAVHPAYLQK